MTAFWVLMQKRQDGKVYADLHKVRVSDGGADGAYHLTEEGADAALAALPAEESDWWHVVPMVGELAAERMRQERDAARKALAAAGLPVEGVAEELPQVATLGRRLCPGCGRVWCPRDGACKACRYECQTRPPTVRACLAGEAPAEWADFAGVVRGVAKALGGAKDKRIPYEVMAERLAESRKALSALAAVVTGTDDDGHDIEELELESIMAVARKLRAVKDAEMKGETPQ